MRQFDQGAKVPAYEDENGTWLSAFAPIKKSSGATVAVVQADQRFDEFLEAAYTEFVIDILISLALLGLLTGVLIYYLKKIIGIEEKSKPQLIEFYKVIEEKNRAINESISYAQRIQHALIPSEKRFIKRAFKDGFYFFMAGIKSVATFLFSFR